MLGTTGRYSIEFRHAGEDYGRHQMLNSDDHAVMVNAFDVTTAQVSLLGGLCDVVSVRLVDNQTTETLTEWSNA